MHPQATPVRRLARRVVFAVVVAIQLTAIVAAYHTDHRVFGFQMFPEASRWRADIVRVEADGTEVPIDENWEYRWSDLVRGRGLTVPSNWSHADAGIDSQLAFLGSAIDWVADNTPADTATVYLEARVSWFENGRGPFTEVIRSPDRQTVSDP